ncbi:hypothetical protein TrST_g423 [Triparma strigata]|uniref:Bifunctional lysine-specific demethylase and histidyl-hydroxylase n=1 Tax=Triparma strigata TaxID=1606541 RepID=A0A9W7B3V7_9STRA|nr:hypothetical protein TrST_g423 [Triparma strigata]
MKLLLLLPFAAGFHFHSNSPAAQTLNPSKQLHASFTDLDLDNPHSAKWSEDFTQSDTFTKTHSIFTKMREYLTTSQPKRGARKIDPLHLKTLCDLKFTTKDLEHAVSTDFLDAGQGTSKMNQGWKMRPVGEIRGSSFDDARLTFSDVRASIQKGTVIFNSAGAHIGNTVAPATLAAVDALDGCVGGVCCNIYVTRGGAPTSAPPHTDKQDVVVIQTQGKKHWRVFSPPDPSLKPDADPFARGKGADDFPLHVLKTQGGELLLDVVLEEGDVLYIPARFPHTTDTVDSGPTEEDWSIHMTFGLDNHVWDLDFINLRRFGLMRAQIEDALLPSETASDVTANHCSGKINELAPDLREWLYSPLPGGLLEVYRGERSEADIDREVTAVAESVMQLSNSIDPACGELGVDFWKEAVRQFQVSGQKVLDGHRDMYLAAMEESERRAKTGEIIGSGTMTQDKIDRLSLFRVPKFFETFNAAKTELRNWAAATPSASPTTIPDDWETSWPLQVGDQVEADLGGAFFPGTIENVHANGLYDVTFFDGDKEMGVARSSIMLKNKPQVQLIEAPSKPVAVEKKLTKKELKRLEKENKKKASLS